MKVKFLRAVGKAAGFYKAGEVADVPAHNAQVYIAHGYAEPVDPPQTPAAPAKPAESKKV